MLPEIPLKIFFSSLTLLLQSIKGKRVYERTEKVSVFIESVLIHFFFFSISIMLMVIANKTRDMTIIVAFFFYFYSIQ